MERLFLFGKKIKYRRKLQGYGLNESDFNKKDITLPKLVTRKIFFRRKERLLKLKLIQKIKSNDKRLNVYSITPLGIAFLFHSRNVKDKFDIRRISKFLGFYEKESFVKTYPDIDFSKFDFKLIESQIKKFSIGKIKGTLTAVLRNMEIIPERYSQRVILTYQWGQKTPVIFEKFDIFESIITISPEYTIPKIFRIEDSVFFSTIAMFIVGSFSHSLVLNNFFNFDDVSNIKLLHETKIKNLKKKRIFQVFDTFNILLMRKLNVQLVGLSTIEELSS